MPFIPFIIGAIVGSAATYVAKDDSSKKMLNDASGKVTGSVGTLTEKVTGIFKKDDDIATEEAEAEETTAAA